jgi:hypothetical protein
MLRVNNARAFFDVLSKHVTYMSKWRDQEARVSFVQK